MSTTYNNWTVTTDTDGFCWLTIDCKDASANTLKTEVLEEFESILDGLNVHTPKGVVIRSGKKSGFIAGADINEFLNIPSVSTANQMIRKVQMIFDKLEALTCPTVAMISGFCLGGGLELSLACKYRVALDSPKTKIGLPEVLLGIQPGWGGSVRLPRLIGSLKALELILPGKLLDARKAKKLGVVDAAVPIRQFETAVKYYLTKAPTPKTAGKMEQILQLEPMRKLVAKYLNSNLAKKVKQEHYPAPYAIVKAWQENPIKSSHAFEAEADSISNLMLTPTAGNLVRVFFLRERLKSFAKKSNFKPKHVHVIGAGVMGGDIAIWCAAMGFEVTVQDNNLDAIAATFKRAEKTFKKKLKVANLIQAAKDRFTPDPEGLGIPKADVIIEAIIEKLEAKHDVFSMLLQKAKPTAILATNTSTIPLADIAAKLPHPERIVGIHFFNPVPLMPLVEVVADDRTDSTVVEHAMTFVGKLDKLPLPVKSASGFLVNRVLIPYLLEAACLFDEGVPPQVIDKVATDFGMPMGPIELMDTVGLDICAACAQSMQIPISEKVLDMVQAGNLGKKSGSGFYQYKNGKAIKPETKTDKDIDRDEIADRIFLRLINEAQECLREKIAADSDLVDAGLIFGAGFAPFRGGPMTYAKDQKPGEIKDKLLQLSEKYGERFAPDPGWG